MRQRVMLWLAIVAVSLISIARMSPNLFGSPQDDQARKAQQDAAKKASDDQARKAQQEQAAKAAADQARKAQQAKDKQAKDDQARKAAQDKAAQDNAAKNSADQARKAQADRDQKAKQEQDRKQKELDDARRRQADQSTQQSRDAQLRQQQADNDQRARDEQAHRDEAERQRRLQEEQNRKPADPAAGDQGDTGFRTWHDSARGSQLEAQFVDLTNGVVHLKKRDGTVVAIAIDRLSDADQDLIGRIPGVYPVVISWQEAPADPATLASAPAIVVRTGQGQAVDNARIVGRFKPQPTGPYKLLAGPNRIPLTNDNPLAAETWTKPLAASIPVLKAGSKGALRVALFKPTDKARPTPAEQLSNWLELPLQAK